MALNFDLGEITDWRDLEEVDDDGKRQLNGQTQYLIMSMMAIGMPRITYENAAEVAARLHTAGLFGQETVVDVVERHIGLRTNVSYETTAKWAVRSLNGTIEDYEHIINYRREMAAKKEA